MFIAIQFKLNYVIGMETLGFKSETVDGLWLCLAMVLLLGDLEVNIKLNNIN